MVTGTSETVLITTKCSGGCNHCPFSNPLLEHLFLSTHDIQKIFKRTKKGLLVISGGEPFEHPEMGKILDVLSTETMPFRIATGGFIDLLPWVNQLKSLCYPNGFLMGISMGSDVLTSRVNYSKGSVVWRKNIHLLNENMIPYSLTITINDDLNFSRLDIWNWDSIFDGKPSFIYLRCPSNAQLKYKWTQKVLNTFDSISIITDEF